MRATHSLPLRESIFSTWHTRPLPRPLLATQWLYSLHRGHVRTLSLYKLSEAKTTLGGHIIKAYKLFQPPPLSEDRAVLLFDKRKRQTAGETGGEQTPELEKLPDTLTVTKLHETIPPGSFLLPTGIDSHWPSSTKVLDPRITSLQYEVRELEPTKPTTKMRSKSQGHALAEIHLQFTAPVSYYHLRLRTAALFLERNRIVEFHVHVPKDALGKRSEKYNSAQENSARKDAAFEWFWSTRPHLWPSIMLKAMPKGTYFRINPYIGNNEVAWVFARSGPGDNALGLSTMLRKNSTKKIEQMRERQEILDMHGEGVPAKPERKNFITEIKGRIRNGEELTEADIPPWYRPAWIQLMKRKKEKSEKNIITAIKALINNGEELTEDEIPEWHRPEWREWMKRRARSVERREGYITMNDQTSRKRKDKMNVSGSAYRAVPGLSWNKTNQGQEPLDRITEEKMNTDGVRRVQDGEKETKALRTATERSRIVATKVRSKPHINDLKEGPNY